MLSLAKYVSSVLFFTLLALSGCQSSNSSSGALEDGSAAPGIDLVEANQGPDGPPNGCDAMSEGTSTTLDCP